MTDLLIRLFVKNRKSPDDVKVRERLGVFSSIVGVVLNILLATVKLLAGILSGSVAIIADALNNFSDAGSSVVSFVSFKIAAKPADRDHPFGHARIEYICSMIVSFIILLVGAELLIESVGGFFDEGEVLSFSALSYTTLGIAIAAKLWLALFYRKIARMIDSSVVKASAADSLFDAISTAAVLISAVIIDFTELTFIDSIVGVGVSLLIIIAGIRILLETKNSLLGEAPVDEVVNGIMEIVSRHEEILGTHDLMIHNYGPSHYIASFHAEVDGKADIYYLHDVVDNIEREINMQSGIICTIHMDPIVTDDETVNELRSFVKKKVAEVCPSADIHDFRTVVGHTHTNLIFDLVLPYEVKEAPGDVCEQIKSAVLLERDNCYCVITVDRA